MSKERLGCTRGCLSRVVWVYSSSQVPTLLGENAVRGVSKVTNRRSSDKKHDLLRSRGPRRRGDFVEHPSPATSSTGENSLDVLYSPAHQHVFKHDLPHKWWRREPHMMDGLLGGMNGWIAGGHGWMDGLLGDMDGWSPTPSPSANMPTLFNSISRGSSDNTTSLFSNNSASAPSPRSSLALPPPGTLGVPS